MDRLDQANLMPVRAPLSRPIQDFRTPYTDDNAQRFDRKAPVLWRLVTFLPALVTTVLLSVVFLQWFETGGVTATEIVLTILVALTFFWIAFSVSTATVGIFVSLFSRTKQMPRTARPMDVAILVPVYNEDPSSVFGNAVAMLEDLQRLQHSRTAHQFSLFVLSDTRDDAIADQELRLATTLRADFGGDIDVHYRRRAENVDHKTGNLADWIENWGGAHEAMLVLDADSLMSGGAIHALTDDMSSDPSVGLIQSVPKIIGARSLFGWVQEFSSSVYSTLLSEGLARWSGREGNFWGHNAIIRTAAFAACAGLPRVRTLRSRETIILSHDFVEAGLLRRAGWAVRFVPSIQETFEEAPQTLIDYIIRDRRWCQGNLQHLRLLRSRGFHAVSRFHLFQGAVAYLMSPAWFVLLVFWALLGNGDNSVLTYFSVENPNFPLWPTMSGINGIFMLLFMYGMLMAPKIMALISLRATGVSVPDLGGHRRFVLAIITEMVLSMAYAPVMMIQQTNAVLRTVIGVQDRWTPQRRDIDGYPLGVLVKFHWLETVTGIALATGMIMGSVSLWLLPIAISLVCAVPLSALSSVPVRYGFGLSRNRAGLDIIVNANRYREHMRGRLAQDAKVAAE